MSRAGHSRAAMNAFCYCVNQSSRVTSNLSPAARSRAGGPRARQVQKQPPGLHAPDGREGFSHRINSKSSPRVFVNAVEMKFRHQAYFKGNGCTEYKKATGSALQERNPASPKAL